MKAELIIIGDEILNGTTLDTNSQFIARELEGLNVEVVRRSTVKDRVDAIEKALAEAETRADVIITTGGLGPTKDDITKKTIANYLGEKLVMNEEVLEHVTQYFKKRGRKMQDVNKLQALVPESAIVLHNELGTAPGTWVERSGKIFISMPGVPYEMRYITENGIIPKLRERYDGLHILHKYQHTVGVGESSIAKQIAEVENDLPAHIRLAYLPSPGIVKLRLTSHGRDVNQLESEINGFQSRIKEILGPIIFGTAEDTLSSTIGGLLKERSLSVGTAESCTSGYLGQLITLTPGSSEYYMGSIVSYSYGLKERLLGVKQETLEHFGAVSKETITEMALGGLKNLETDYIIATSGIAGPGGGMKNKPVGTVWVAVGNKEQVISKKFLFTNDRTRNIHLTGVMALDMLRRMILGLPINGGDWSKSS